MQEQFIQKAIFIDRSQNLILRSAFTKLIKTWGIEVVFVKFEDLLSVLQKTCSLLEEYLLFVKYWESVLHCFFNYLANFILKEFKD